MKYARKCSITVRNRETISVCYDYECVIVFFELWKRYSVKHVQAGIYKGYNDLGDRFLRCVLKMIILILISTLTKKLRLVMLHHVLAELPKIIETLNIVYLGLKCLTLQEVCYDFICI